MNSKTKLFLTYVFESFLDSFKKFGTWIYIVTFISIIGLFLRIKLITILGLVLILILSIIRDLTSPSFKRYTRDKQGIPSKSEIRRLKYGNIRRIYEPVEGEESTTKTVDFARDEFNKQN